MAEILRYNGGRNNSEFRISKEVCMNTESSHLILVADDEADIRALLRILLEKDGHRVLEAADGIQTLEELKGSRQGTF